MRPVSWDYNEAVSWDVAHAPADDGPGQSVLNGPLCHLASPTLCSSPTMRTSSRTMRCLIR